MKLNLIESKEILDLEKELNCELIVTERAINSTSAPGLSRYYVQFENSYISVNEKLLETYGDGNTVDAALNNYCFKLCNRTLVLDSHDEESRREIKLPYLKHTNPAPKQNKL